MSLTASRSSLSRTSRWHAAWQRRDLTRANADRRLLLGAASRPSAASVIGGGDASSARPDRMDGVRPPSGRRARAASGSDGSARPPIIAPEPRPRRTLSRATTPRRWRARRKNPREYADAAASSPPANPSVAAVGARPWTSSRTTRFPRSRARPPMGRLLRPPPQPPHLARLRRRPREVHRDGAGEGRSTRSSETFGARRRAPSRSSPSSTPSTRYVRRGQGDRASLVGGPPRSWSPRGGGARAVRSAANPSA